VITDWPHGTGVASISRSISAVAGVRAASHRSAAPGSGPAARSRWLYSALSQQPGEQVPHPRRGGAQPVPLLVITQQHLRHPRQTLSASVTSGRCPGPERVKPKHAMIESVSST
jgi:hypothetical protein